MARLESKTIAILAADGFEQIELTSPKDTLEKEGATVHIISPKTGTIRGFHHTDTGDTFSVDKAVTDVKAEDYDGLVIPGGLFNPDTLRQDDETLLFVRGFFEQGKPVGAICHGPQVLISAGMVDGRSVTGVKPIQIDLTNAGGRVKDEAVVVDSGLVTSRHPGDLDAFNKKLVEEFGEGRHAAQARKAA
jgi:protease I